MIGRVKALLVLSVAALSVLVWSAGGFPSAIVTWHVSTGGSDANPGTFAQPFRTIQKAVTVVSPGDTIVVHPGTYTGKVTIRRSGAAGKFITLRPAVDPEVSPVTIRATFPAPNCEAQEPASVRTLMIVNGADFWIIRDFKIEGGILIFGSRTDEEMLPYVRDRTLPGRSNYNPEAARTTLKQLGSNGADYIRLIGNDITGMGIYGSQTRYGLLDGNVIHHTRCGTGSAVWLTTFSDQWRMRNNYVHHTDNPPPVSTYHWQSEGIRLGRASMYNVIEDNIIEDLAGLGRGINMDVLAGWNIIRRNTVTRAFQGMAEQAGGGWGNKWLYNKTDASTKVGFMFAGKLAGVSYADSLVPRFTRIECHESKNEPLGLSIGAARQANFINNKFTKVYIAPKARNEWAQAANQWNGQPVPPPEFPNTSGFANCTSP